MSPVSPPPLNIKALRMGRLPGGLQGTARLIYEDKNSQKAEGGGVLGKYYDRLGKKGLSGSHHSPLFCLAQEASLAFHKQGQCSVTEPPACPSLLLPYHCPIQEARTAILLAWLHASLKATIGGPMERLERQGQ